MTVLTSTILPNQHLPLQEKHEIETNFETKKKLVVIVTKLETLLETKNFWFLN